MFFIESQRNIVFTFNDQPLELLLKKRLWRDLTILFSMENEKQMLQFPFLSMNCTLSRCTKFSVKVNFSSMYFNSNADQKYEISDFRKSSCFGIKGIFNQNKSINYHFCLFIHSQTLQDLRTDFMAVFLKVHSWL